MKRKVLYTIFLLVFATNLGFSQSDSNKAILPHKLATDTVSINTPEERPTERNPKRAAMMSAVCPGLGQIYNHKYWKLPIVYAALGTAGYFVISNRSYYNNMKAAYIQDINDEDGDVSIYYDQGYGLTDIQNAAEQYRTWMEYSAVAFTAVYVLQIIDATVDAHLYYFDVSDDLSMRLEPKLLYSVSRQPVHGLSLNFTF
jgi:hypothetical protein